MESYAFLVLNDVIIYGVIVPFLAMALSRIIIVCILLVNYGMYSLCIMPGVYYCDDHMFGILLRNL